MKDSIVYLLICGSLLFFQVAGFFSQNILYTDNPLLIVASTLAVLLLPGMLIYPYSKHMRSAHEEYGLSAVFTLMAAFSFVLQFVICVAAFALKLNISQSAVLLFFLSSLLFTISIVKIVKGEKVVFVQGKWKDPFNHAVFIFYLLLFPFLLYRLGTMPYDIGGEMLLQMTTVRKIFENPFLTIDNVHYAHGEINTYVLPVWQFSIALIAKLSRIDPLIVFFKLRWFGAVYAIVPIYALINIIFKDYRHKALTINIIASIAFTGIYITDYQAITISDVINRGIFNLFPTPHTSDIAMAILLPIGIFLSLSYLRRPDLISAVFLTAYFTMVAVFHVREYFQVLFYIIPFAPVLLFTEKSKMKSYLELIAAILMAGLLMYGIQMLYAAKLAHIGAEMSKKWGFLAEILTYLKERPVELIKPAKFYGFAELNMLLCLLTFYLLPVFLFRAGKGLEIAFITTSILASFIVSQTTILKNMMLLLTYSEFFIATARLISLFVYLILGFLLAEIIIATSCFAKQHSERAINNEPLRFFLVNIVGVISTAAFFGLLTWYVKKGNWLESYLQQILYLFTWIYSIVIVLIIKRGQTRKKLFNLSESRKPLLPAVPVFLVIIAFIITPNLFSSVQKNMVQNKGIWDRHTITGVPSSLISFVRKNVPMGSIFGVDTASRTSIFLYANVYVDHFPPLICDNIRREDEAYEHKFDKRRPVYGEDSTLQEDIEYIRINKIKYIIFEPTTPSKTKERYDGMNGFKKVYQQDGYTVLEVQ